MKIKSNFAILDVLNTPAIKALQAAPTPTPVVVRGTILQNPCSRHDGTSQEFQIDVTQVLVFPG